MSNGWFSISGVQTQLPSQGQNTLGPFTINFSGCEVDYVVECGVNTEINIPGSLYSPQGVLVVPPSTGTVALTIKGATTDTGLLMSPNQPFYWPFDTSDYPDSFFVSAASTVNVGIRFT